jgi:hypothetical protein
MALTHAWHDLSHDLRDEVHDLASITRVDAARQAYLGLWVTFVALPLLLGLDKIVGFAGVRWEGYLAAWVDQALPGTAADAVMWLGIAEIVIAGLVLFVARIGGDVMGAWMALAAVSLFMVGGMAHLALAALALGACAVCMAHLSTTYHHQEG